MDGGARLLVQRGLLANPVEDLPAQGPVVILGGLRVQKTNIRNKYKIYTCNLHQASRAGEGRCGTACYLEDDVAVGLVELSMERFIHLEWNKILYLPNGHTRNLKRGAVNH